MKNPYRSGCGVGLTGRIRAAVMSESGTGDNQRAGWVVPCPARGLPLNVWSSRSAAQCLAFEVCLQGLAAQYLALKIRLSSPASEGPPGMCYCASASLLIGNVK